MNFINIPIMQAMTQKLKYHAERQAALAQNIANADTPSYKAMDIKAPDFAGMMSKMSSGMGMVTTSPMHFQAGGGKRGGSGSLMQREDTYELNPIGNNVVLEEEVMNVGQNQQEYQKVLSIYRKSVDMFKLALGRGSNV